MGLHGHGASAHVAEETVMARRNSVWGIFLSVEVSSIIGYIIAVIIGVAMWLCGLSSITSMSRMWYACACDNGMPGSGLIKQIHPTLRTPIWAIIITCIGCNSSWGHPA